MKFVIGRKYTIKMDGEVTGFSFVTYSAVPQGSHIGPLLFNIATMNIVTIIEGTDVIILLYADDTKLLMKVRTENDTKILQKVIDDLMKWALDNGFAINQQKTYHVQYKKARAQTFDSRYYVAGEPIEKVSKISDLGVTFDEHMSFVPHIERIHTKARNMTLMANRFVREIRCPHMITKIIDTYVRPIIEYNSVIWRDARQSITKKLEESLHRGTRTALRSPYRTNAPGYLSFDARMKDLGLLTFAERRDIATVVFIVKLLREETLSILTEHIEELIHINVRNTRSPHLFDISRSTFARNTPIIQMLQLVNSIKSVITLEDSPNTIKCKLKKFYLNARM